MITQPLRAAKLTDLSKLRYPLSVTPKLDGIRALKINGEIVSKSFKPIPNHYIRTTLNIFLENGMDGEIMLRNTADYNSIQSAVMSRDGNPDFIFWAFDWVQDSLHTPYFARIQDLSRKLSWFDNTPNQYIKVLRPYLIDNEEELIEYELEVLAKGYEGVIIRDPHGKYKCGKATMREGIIIKMKRFEDSEAVVIGFEEKETNNNEKTIDAFGLAKRSSKKEGKVAAGTLGNLLVRDLKSDIEFSVGSGLTASLRDEIWQNQEQYLGKILTYKYFPVGVKEKPRHPTFKGFRHEDDI